MILISPHSLNANIDKTGVRVVRVVSERPESNEQACADIMFNIPSSRILAERKALWRRRSTQGNSS